MKALAQPGAYVIPPQNVNVENFHNSMPRVLNSPVLRGFLRSNLGKARERAPQHVADFSAYEKAAFIFRKELKQLIDTWIDANEIGRAHPEPAPAEPRESPRACPPARC